VRPVKLRIDRLAVEIEREAQAAQVEPAIRSALALLAQRLGSMSQADAQEATFRALELIELGPVSPDWLSGPGAASRLADDLYRKIVG